jgi:hypothetical protein
MLATLDIMVQIPSDELLEKLYFHEIAMRDAINGRLQNPVAALISVIGAQAIMISQVAEIAPSSTLIAFGMFSGLACLFAFMAARNFVQAAFGHSYAFLSVARRWSEYEYECYIQFQRSPDTNTLIAESMSRMLRNELASCSSTNADINNLRTLSLEEGIANLVIGVVFSVIAFACLQFTKLNV